jgi:glycosyltransferase involved in cell wall biosynthesis
LGIADRCAFRRSVPNDELCRSLKDYDMLISVNDYGGVSKVELEAAHVGLPVITNRHPQEAEPEVLGANCIVVEGDAGSYGAAIKRLLGNTALRQGLGTALRRSASHLTSDRMEQAYASLYREIVRGD